MLLELSEKTIKECFDGKTDQLDVLVAIYRVAFPVWNRISTKARSPSHTWALSQVCTRPNGEAGYFFRALSRHSNTMIPVPANAKNNPTAEPAIGPLGASKT